MKKKLTFTLSALVNIEAFCLVLLGGALITWLEPKATMSESEKRELAPYPSFTFEKFFEGNYTDSLDLYYADHFAHRESWVDFTASLKSYFGFRDELMVYQSDNPQFINAGDSLKLDSLEMDSLKTPREIKKDPTGKGPEIKNSILIYNGMAFQLFGRYNEAEKNFASTINLYKQKLGDSMRVFACVVPSPIDFYLPEEYKSKSNREKPSIDFIYEQLSPNVLSIDAYSNLEANVDDFIYFKTDHHWTARGAYQAYRAFCRKAGYEAVPLTSFKRHVRKNFLGSLYYATLDPRLKTSGDSLEYFMLPIPVIGQRYSDRNLKKIMPTDVVSQRLGQAGSYLTFIGGDYPLTRIISGNRNGKKILMVKDSYGNAMAPFLALHYQEVYVIDYRSFDSNIIDFLRNNNVDDLLFLHNVAIANTKYAGSREASLTRVKDLAPQILPDTTHWEP
jgi:hypothetical protein